MSKTKNIKAFPGKQTVPIDHPHFDVNSYDLADAMLKHREK